VDQQWFPLSWTPGQHTHIRHSWRSPTITSQRHQMWWRHRPSNRTYFFIIINIILSGVRLSPLGTAATVGLLYQPQMTWWWLWSNWWNEVGRGSRSTRRKPATALLCPPQIPHDLTRIRTRAAAVGSQRLTAWAMVRPLMGPSLPIQHPGNLSFWGSRAMLI
jgi:hypothetical protein